MKTTVSGVLGFACKICGEIVPITKKVIIAEKAGNGEVLHVCSAYVDHSVDAVDQAEGGSECILTPYEDGNTFRIAEVFLKSGEHVYICDSCGSVLESALYVAISALRNPLLRLSAGVYENGGEEIFAVHKDAYDSIVKLNALREKLDLIEHATYSSKGEPNE